MGNKESKTAAPPQEDHDLDDLIFYAIDKVSPYTLALHPETDSLDKIADQTLNQLNITADGIGMMWLIINAHADEYGISKISPASLPDINTVKDVRDAVYAAKK
jgi:hypothetical protein